MHIGLELYCNFIIEAMLQAPRTAAKTQPRQGPAPKWERDMATFTERERLPRNCRLWTSQKPTPIGLPPGQREIALINVAWALRMKDSSWPSLAAARQQYYVNIHDSLLQFPWGGMKTLKQCSNFYSFEEAYMFTGHDHMRFQGWPKQLDTTGLRDQDLKSLAGEGLSLPCCVLVHMAYFLNPFAPWW
jgi:hypothetical protein